jgi:hypothetical protein
VIVSEETNTDFGDCSSLKRKGFDISMVNKLTQTCQ